MSFNVIFCDLVQYVYIYIYIYIYTPHFILFAWSRHHISPAFGIFSRRKAATTARAAAASETHKATHTARAHGLPARLEWHLPDDEA